MKIKDYISLLRLNPLFYDFSSQHLLKFFTKSNHTISEYKKNCVIHFESEICSSLDLILKGEVMIQKIDEKGNILTVTQFKSGDIIGGNLLFSKNPCYPMNVIAKLDTAILHIDKSLILQLCQNNKKFLLEFLSCISDKTTILTDKIKSITMKTIRESIIDFLNYEYYSQNSNQIKLNMTKKELAERLGIQRTSLSRELNKMKKEGLVCYDAHSITILDKSIIKNTKSPL